MEDQVERIMDANLNRALEGIRVVEEIARFILEDKRISAQLKDLRHQLRKIVIPKLVFRDSAQDLGRKFYSKSEKKRAGIKDIFAANIKRAQEALRVLEEFSKLSRPGLGKKIKEIRFRLYDLEKDLSIRGFRPPGRRLGS